MVFFCIFHIIFTGFSLSWTRRILRQARIRDVKYYTNRELSPVLKGVFPQTTGCALKYPPSLHLRSNCCWGDIAFVPHSPWQLGHEKNAGWEEKRAANIFDLYYTVYCILLNSLQMNNQFECVNWLNLRNTLCSKPFPPWKVSIYVMPALQQNFRDQ